MQPVTLRRRVRTLTIVAIGILLLGVWPCGWTRGFAATGGGPGVNGGMNGTGGAVQGEVSGPGPQPATTPVPTAAPPGPVPTDSPAPPNSGGGGGTPPPSPPATAAQSCPPSPYQPSTVTINPVYGLTPGGPIQVAAIGCGRAVLNNPTPPTALNMANSPPPNLEPYVAQAFEQIVTTPGTISAAPPNHTGLVNMPQCYWLTGQSVTGTQTVSMDLKGAPNAAGKQITYHIALTVELANTVWNFGDGSQQTTTVPIPCIGDSGGASSLVAHNYVTYSQGQTNGTFLVTASETYQASAVMTWNDDNGPESQNVTLNGNTTTLSTPPYPVRIDQEEGVGN